VRLREGSGETCASTGTEGGCTGSHTQSGGSRRGRRGCARSAGTRDEAAGGAFSLYRNSSVSAPCVSVSTHGIPLTPDIRGDGNASFREVAGEGSDTARGLAREHALVLLRRESWCGLYHNVSRAKSFRMLRRALYSLFSSGRTATPASVLFPGRAPTPEVCSPGLAPSGSSEGSDVLGAIATTCQRRSSTNAV
jgi:hypothetical protein